MSIEAGMSYRDFLESSAYIVYAAFEQRKLESWHWYSNLHAAIHNVGVIAANLVPGVRNPVVRPDAYNPYKKKVPTGLRLTTDAMGAVRQLGQSLHDQKR